MEKIDRTYDFKGHSINVFKGDESDMNWNEEIIIKLTSPDNEGTLILQPLWNLDGIEEAEIKEYKKKYLPGHYFQQTFATNPKGRGLGGVIHDFLIAYKGDFQIVNVYSTNTAEDEHVISEDARSFWQNRIDQGKAVYDEDLHRFKMRFEDEELCKDVKFRTMNTRQKEVFYEIFEREIISDEYIRSKTPLRFVVYGSPDSNRIPVNCYNGDTLVRFFVIDFYNQEYLPECNGINGTSLRFWLNCDFNKWPPKIFYCINEELTKELNGIYAK